MQPQQCLRVLAVNSWNPPPGNRKMHGDLMYLNVVTVEGRDLNITASTRGFYLNQSVAWPRVCVSVCVCARVGACVCVRDGWLDEEPMR